jgi:hypothetical protein
MPWAIYTSSTRPFEVAGLCGSAWSSRHIEDHIQSIQVLNCSSLGCLWLGFLAAFAFGKSQKTTIGRGCHSKPQPKAAFP